MIFGRVCCAVPLRGLDFSFIAVVACVWALAVAAPAAAWAVPGKVYSCTVHPTYAHPVTGAVEDSGGASAQATGQAMAESCVSSAGMMEVADSGECFLTMRLSLVDLTSNHSFLVQDRGGSGWSTPAMGVTGTGSDRNGTTNDVCVQLPSQRGIVRVSMLVESMGREVVFYVCADGLCEPAPEGFAATVVTEASGGAAAGAAGAAGADDVPVAGDAQAQGGADQGSPEQDVQAQGQAAQGAGLLEGAGVPAAQGLSLSTAGEVGDAGPVEIDVRAVAAGAGLFLVAVVPGLAFAFWRRRRGCAGCDPDDYSAEYCYE